MSADRIESADDLERLFLDHYKELYRYVFVRVRQRDIAEDLTQETFMKAWKARDSYDPKRASVRHWLYTITINTLRSHYRKQKHRRTEELPEQLPSDLNIPEDAQHRDMFQRLLHHMERLSERDRNLILLHHMEGLPLEEVAQILSMRRNAAKTALHRARKKLKSLCDISDDMFL